jgi:hypothetical protein
MRIIPLPLETQAQMGFNRKLVLTYLDLLAWTSGTAQAVVPQNALGASSINNLANSRVSDFLTRVITPFTSSGGAITSLTLSLGDGGSATRFVNAVDLKTAACVLGTTTQYLYTSADTIDAVATISGQTMASLNAGAVEIYFREVDVNPLQYVAQP